MTAMAKRIMCQGEMKGTQIVAETRRGTLFREHEPAAYEFSYVGQGNLFSLEKWKRVNHAVQHLARPSWIRVSESAA